MTFEPGRKTHHLERAPCGAAFTTETAREKATPKDTTEPAERNIRARALRESAYAFSPRRARVSIIKRPAAMTLLDLCAYLGLGAAGAATINLLLGLLMALRYSP